MKYQWHWTPYGWLRAIVAIGLLGGAAFVDGVLSYILIGIGLCLMLYGYARTLQVRGKMKRQNKGEL